jgi:alkanesulfonate monooxygenase SsuD/methylene tetrahydromethanopterin reductase-like flavin-dependent oxidoreductase (luciferase family)
MANVLLAPTRDTFMLAKQAATIQSLSDGRLVLGLGVGRRSDDYDVVALRFGDRGRRFDGMLEQLNRLWGRDEEMVPAAFPPVPLLIGGQTDATIRRVAKWGIGWTSGGSRSLPEVAAFATRVRDAWRDAGRLGQPRILALSYFSIGNEELSREQTLAYYGFMGARAHDLAAAVPHDEEGILAVRDLSAELGIDELTFIPTVNDIEQLRGLARIVFD